MTIMHQTLEGFSLAHEAFARDHPRLQVRDILSHHSRPIASWTNGDIEEFTNQRDTTGSSWKLNLPEI